MVTLIASFWKASNLEILCGIQKLATRIRTLVLTPHGYLRFFYCLIHVFSWEVVLLLLPSLPKTSFLMLRELCPQSCLFLPFFITWPPFSDVLPSPLLSSCSWGISTLFPTASTVDELKRSEKSRSEALLS